MNVIGQLEAMGASANIYSRCSSHHSWVSEGLRSCEKPIRVGGVSSNGRSCTPLPHVLTADTRRGGGVRSIPGQKLPGLSATGVESSWRPCGRRKTGYSGCAVGTCRDRQYL